MTGNRAKKEARALMAEHPGMKYTEALAVVQRQRPLEAVLAKVKERNER